MLFDVLWDSGTEPAAGAGRSSVPEALALWPTWRNTAAIQARSNITKQVHAPASPPAPSGRPRCTSTPTSEGCSCRPPTPTFTPLRMVRSECGAAFSTAACNRQQQDTRWARALPTRTVDHSSSQEEAGIGAPFGAFVQWANRQDGSQHASTPATSTASPPRWHRLLQPPTGARTASWSSCSTASSYRW